MKPVEVAKDIDRAGASGSYGWRGEAVKKRCPDCNLCQMCSETKCRLCRNANIAGLNTLPRAGFTLFEYEEWQKKRGLKNLPVIDIKGEDD
jgi:hypothetical protein